MRPNIAEPQSRPQKSLGIDRFVIDPCFVMQMRTSRTAGRADLADGLSDPDLVANFDVDYGHVAVAGGQSVSMVDFHHLPVAALPASDRHAAVAVARTGSPVSPRKSMPV